MCCSVASGSQMSCSPRRTSRADLREINPWVTLLLSQLRKSKQNHKEGSIWSLQTQYKYITVKQMLQTCSWVIMFPTLICSVQQRAPTPQTEGSHRSSCTPKKETLGRVQSFWDTHILQLSCHLHSGQLKMFKSKQRSKTWSKPIPIVIYEKEGNVELINFQ